MAPLTLGLKLMLEPDKNPKSPSDKTDNPYFMFRYISTNFPANNPLKMTCSRQLISQLIDMRPAFISRPSIDSLKLIPQVRSMAGLVL